jgi:hypothetical protein
MDKYMLAMARGAYLPVIKHPRSFYRRAVQ